MRGGGGGGGIYPPYYQVKIVQFQRTKDELPSFLNKKKYAYMQG